MDFPPSFFDLCLDICTYRVDNRVSLLLYMSCVAGAMVVRMVAFL
jgi:hypothetical protein